MKRFLQMISVGLLLLPLAVNVPQLWAETISWMLPTTYVDNTAISAADRARIAIYLRGWKDGNPGAKTYFGEKRDGAASWTDNVMVRMNQWGASNAVPGWVPVKPWDNVFITASAALKSATDNVERDSPESPPIAWTIPGPAAFAAIGANPAVLVRGACSMLTWTTTDAVSASIDQGIGSVPLTGTRQACPVVDTTYKISAVNPGGTTTATAQIAVSVPVQPGCNSPTGLTIKQ